MTPLVPAHVDLRDFPYMPLEVVRLRDSDLAGTASDGAFRAAVILWCAAWHQLPAASLPDDDRMLARLAGFGKDVDAWLEVKDEAMRNFVKCDDGRLYHTTIARKALEAWEAKQRQRERTEAARRAKWSKASEGVSGKKRKPSVTESVTGSKGREGKRIDSTAANPNGSAAVVEPPPDFQKLCERTAGASYPKGFGTILEAAKAGADIQTRILPMIGAMAREAREKGRTISSWAYFAPAISDEARPTPGALLAYLWCEVGSPEFRRGNAARVARGEKPLRGLPSRHHDRKGASFPAADVRDDRAQA